MDIREIATKLVERSNLSLDVFLIVGLLLAGVAMSRATSHMS